MGHDAGIVRPEGFDTQEEHVPVVVSVRERQPRDGIVARHGAEGLERGSRRPTGLQRPQIVLLEHRDWSDVHPGHQVRGHGELVAVDLLTMRRDGTGQRPAHQQREDDPQ